MPTTTAEIELYQSASGYWHVQRVEGGYITDWAPGVPSPLTYAHRRSARKAARRDHPGLAIVDVAG